MYRTRRPRAGPYLRYREVLGRGCPRVCADLGSPTDDEVEGSAGRSGVAGLPGLGAALAALAGRFRLAVITTATTTCSPPRTGSSGDVRLDRRGPAGELQTQPSQLRAGVRPDRRAARASSTSRKPPTTCRRGAWPAVGLDQRRAGREGAGPPRGRSRARRDAPGHGLVRGVSAPGLTRRPIRPDLHTSERRRRRTRCGFAH